MSKKNYYLLKQGKFDYSEWLTKIVVAKGIQCKVIANTLRVSKSYCSVIMRGGAPLSYSQIISICKEIDADVNNWAEESEYVKSILSVS